MYRHFVTKPLKRLFMNKLLLERDYRGKNCWHTSGVFSYSRSPFGDQRKIHKHSESLIIGNLPINTEDFYFHIFL